MLDRLVQLYSAIKPKEHSRGDRAKKQENLRLFQETIDRPEAVIRNKPLQLFLEITSKCNLRCAKCGMNYDPARLKAQKIPFSFLQSMNEFFQTAVEVHTFGYGEMFLYPELPQLVQILKAHNCRVSGITNGTRIGKKEISWLVKNRYDELTFSIDGATQETMKRLRGANLNKILETLSLLKKEKDRRGSDLPKIVVNFVAQKDNFRELPRLARILIDLEIFFLGVNTLHHFYGSEDKYSKFYHKFCLLNAPRAEVEAVIEETRGLIEESGASFANYIDMDFEWRNQTLEVTQPTSVEQIAPARAEEKPLPHYYCLYPWMTLYLAADMTSKVCCYMSAEENLGSFSSGRDVNEIWQGSKLTEIRNYIASGRIHPACQVCVEHGSYKSYQAALKAIEGKLKDDSLDLDASEAEIDECAEDRVAPAYEGWHDIANRNVIHGWAWDARHPKRRVRVEILDGRKVVAVVRANEFRQDLLNAGKAEGHCAFTYRVPASIRDGNSHSIRVRVAGTKQDLSGTPKQVEGRNELER